MIYNLVKKVALGKIGSALRVYALKLQGAKIGKSVYIASHVDIIHPPGLIVGNNVSIHLRSYIDCKGGVVIGNDVSIAHDCSILSFNHTRGGLESKIRNNPLILSRVKIGNDVWIGCKVVLLAGVDIGDHTIIGAGSIVTKSIAANSLAVGNPAVVK